MLAMKRSRLKLAALLVLALASAVCSGTKGTISVVNNAEEPISRATIRVSGQTLEIVNLGPSETATGSYAVTQDGHYAIEVVFLSGKRLNRETGHREIGYIPSRFDLDDRIVITGSAIEFQTH
jgi:hypothetical protein